MEATLIGESSKLDRIWTEEFRRTGTYHMLVIDGLTHHGPGCLPLVSVAPVLHSGIGSPGDDGRRSMALRAGFGW